MKPDAASLTEYYLGVDGLMAGGFRPEAARRKHLFQMTIWCQAEPGSKFQRRRPDCRRGFDDVTMLCAAYEVDVREFLGG